MKRLIRLAFYGVSAFFWLAVLWIVFAELPALWRLKSLERHNPYIARHIREKVTPFIDDFAAASLLPSLPAALPVPPPPTVTWSADGATSTPDDFCVWGTPANGEDGAHVETRRKAFPGLCEKDRFDYASVQMEMVAHFSASWQIITAYCPNAPDFPNLRYLLQSIRKAPGTHYEDLVSPEKTRVFFLQDARDQSTYVFIDARQLYYAEHRKNLPDDSPYDVAWLKYKKNLRAPHARLGEFFSRRNNFGFRGKDIAVPKPKGVFRILCIGGSTTEEGEEGHTYPDLLEGLLRERFPDRKIEVVNCGVGGRTTIGNVIMLPDFFEAEPDLFVIYDGVNDICQDLPNLWRTAPEAIESLADFSWFMRAHANPANVLPDRKIDQYLDFLPIQNMHLVRRAAACRHVPVVVCSLAAPDPKVLSEREREYFDWNAQTFWERRLTIGAYCHVADRLNTRIRAFCAREGLLYIPVAENMGGGIYYFSDLCHLYQRGIERKAKVIAQYLGDYLAPAMKSQPL